MSSDEFNALEEKNRVRFIEEIGRVDCVAAIRQRDEQVQEMSRQLTVLQSERERLEKHLRTALEGCDDMAVLVIASLKRENAELKTIVSAADKLETLLQKNTGGDVAKELADKLTALSLALKPYRRM